MWAVLPVKAFSKAKQRLKGVLSDEQRASLSRSMLVDSIRALAQVDAITDIVLVVQQAVESLVLTADDDEITIEKVTIIEQPEHVLGLNASLRYACDVVIDKHVNQVIILPTDMPLMTADAIQRLCCQALAYDVTLVPDADNKGTNGLVTSLPLMLPLLYGNQSFIAYHQAARQNQLNLHVHRDPLLALDIDKPQDLEYLLQTYRCKRDDIGKHTRQWLDQCQGDLLIAQCESV